jgi:hypothetical protein
MIFIGMLAIIVNVAGKADGWFNITMCIIMAVCWYAGMSKGRNP